MQTWQFLLKRVWSAGAPRIFAPARTPQKPQIFGKGIFAVLLYNAKEQVLLLPTPPGKKTSGFVSMGAQYRAPTSREETAMKLGPGPKGA